MLGKLAVVLLLCAVVIEANPWTPQGRVFVWWLNRHYALLNQTKTLGPKIEVVFLGDDLTDYWSAEGQQIWQQYFAPRNCYNYAINGDRSEHQLWRITSGSGTGGELDGLTSKLVVLMIGTNNVPNGDNATAIVKGISTHVEVIQSKVPTAKVLLLSILPRESMTFDIEINDINQRLPALADNEQVFYLNLADFFQTSVGHEVPDLYTNQILLSSKGYQMWYEVMEPMFEYLLK